MAALHLIPVENAFSVRFHPEGDSVLSEGGQYSFVPMSMVQGKWVTAGANSVAAREALDGCVKDDVHIFGEVDLRCSDDRMVFRFRNARFGMCSASAFSKALESARLEAAKRDRSVAAPKPIPTLSEAIEAGAGPERIGSLRL